jgi:hypothetical protein
VHINRLKRHTNILDKASKYFEKEIAQKYGYKIINFIDVKGIRFVIAEKDEFLYAISLLVIGSEPVNKRNKLIDLNLIRDFTKIVARTCGCGLAASFVIHLEA